MAWIAAAASVAGTAINANARKAQAAAMMGQPAAGAVETVFDNSGWNVSIGGGRIDSSATKTTEQSGTTPQYAAAGGLPIIAGQGAADSSLIYVAIVFLVVMAWKRKNS